MSPKWKRVAGLVALLGSIMVFGFGIFNSEFPITPVKPLMLGKDLSAFIPFRILDLIAVTFLVLVGIACCIAMLRAE